MNLFQELRQRRVPQIVSAYLVGSWGAIQFLEFLESRMAVSPHLVNLVGLFLLLLLPSIVAMAWIHGRPGRDSWGRTPKIVLPANFLAILLLLVFLFNGRDLGAVTETIEVEDENGTVTERVIPKSEFRRRLLVFYPENIGAAEDDWAREAIVVLQITDINQDVFVDAQLPASMPLTFTEAGFADGHLHSRVLQRKIARDAHRPYFLTGTLDHVDGVWILATVLHESESGREAASRTFEADNLFSLADLSSRQVRQDLGIPASHLENSQDLPVSELTSTDMTAVRSYVDGLIMITHHNDWEAAAPLFEAAVEPDPGFAGAQYLRYHVLQTLGEKEKGSAAINAAMENLYRIPERTQFLVKATYYYNEKQDMDKSIAVLQMWRQLYPNDVEPHIQLATFHTIQQDLPAVIADYEMVLAIDPSRVQFLDTLADLHNQLGHYDEAEGYLQRYVEMFPAETEGYENLADFYSVNGQLDLARASLEKAQLLEPGKLELALGLIDLDIKTGDYVSSRKALEEHLAGAKTARNRARVYIRLANLANLTGKADVVSSNLELYYKALTEFRNPMQVDVVYTMLLPLVSAAGDPEGALARLNELSEKISEPFDKLSGVGKAWALTDLGRPEEARVALAEAGEVIATYGFETLRPSVALVEGMIAEASSDLGTAVEQYRIAHETALAVDPLYPLHLARALRLSGDGAEAAKVLAEILTNEPAQPVAHLEMALLQHQQGKLNQASEHLKIAQAAWLEASPNYPPAHEARALAAALRN